MGTANISYGFVDAWHKGRATNNLFVESVSENLTTNEITSAATTAVAPAEQNRGLSVRVILSEDGWLKIGAAPTANKTTSMKALANIEYFFGIAPDHKVAVIDNI